MKSRDLTLLPTGRSELLQLPQYKIMQYFDFVKSGEPATLFCQFKYLGYIYIIILIRYLKDLLKALVIKKECCGHHQFCGHNIRMP